MKNLTREAAMQELRAEIAKELVGERGYTKSKAARMLGVTPSAVSQYISGKRGGHLARELLSWGRLQRLVRQMAEKIAKSQGKLSDLELFKAAERMVSGLNNEAPPYSLKGSGSKARHGWKKTLEARLSEEQLAAKENMDFAEKSRDELVKVVFRQIASDSLRHADIVSMLLNHLEGSDQYSRGRLPSEREMMEIIRKEEAADAGEADISRLRNQLGPAAQLLMESIDADEKKHLMLLKGLARLASATGKEKKV